MKKTIIALLVLLLAAGGSLGAYYAVKDKKDTESRQEQELVESYSLFSFDAEKINKVDIHCPDGDYTCSYDGEIWTLDGEESTFRVDQEYMQGVVNFTSYLTAVTSYSGDDEKKAEYGLDDPYIITLYSDTESYTVYTGDVSPTGEYCYTMLDGRDSVYAIDAGYEAYLRPTRMLMKSKHLIPYKDSEVIGVKLVSGGSTVYDLTFDTESKVWSLPDEYSMLTFDQTAVDTMVIDMGNTEASYEHMLEEHLEDLSKYGFDDPTAELFVTGADGSVCHLLFSNSKDETGRIMSVLNTEDNQVSMYATSSLSFLNNRPYDFLAHSDRRSYIYTVPEFTLTYNGKEHHITYDNENSKVVFDGTEVLLDTSEKALSYQSMFDCLGIIYLADTDIDADPELKDPLVSADIHVNDGTSYTYDIVDAGNDLCYVFIDGKYTGGLISKKNIVGRDSFNQFYNRFLESTGLSEETTEE